MEANDINSLILMFMEAHKFGEYIWQLFFGLHLIALGYLIMKSNYFPNKHVKYGFLCIFL